MNSNITKTTRLYSRFSISVKSPLNIPLIKRTCLKTLVASTAAYKLVEQGMVESRSRLAGTAGIGEVGTWRCGTTLSPPQQDDALLEFSRVFPAWTPLPSPGMCLGTYCLL